MLKMTTQSVLIADLVFRSQRRASICYRLARVITLLAEHIIFESVTFQLSITFFRWEHDEAKVPSSHSAAPIPRLLAAWKWPFRRGSRTISY